MTTTEQITKVLAFLAALYPRFELTAATIKAYTHVLQDIPPDLLQTAAEKLGGESVFFPSAAEIRQTAFDLLDAIDGIPEPYEALTSGNKHPLVAKARAAVGDEWYWQRSTNPTGDRIRFIEIYKELLKRRKEEVRATPQVRNYIEDGRAKQLESGPPDDVARIVAETANRMLKNGNAWE